MKRKTTIMTAICFLLTVLSTLAYGWSERSNLSANESKNYDAMFFIY